MNALFPCRARCRCALIGFLSITAGLFGQASFSSFNTPYTQNFDAFDGSAATVPTGFTWSWTTFGGYYNRSGAYGSSRATFALRDNPSDTDVAFGVKIESTGTTQTLTWTFVNNTGQPISTLLVNWAAEQYSVSGRASVVSFDYNPNGAGFTTTGVANATSYTASTTSGAGANLSVAARTTFVNPITLATPLATGQSIVFRWSFSYGALVGTTNSNAHLGIDDLAVTAVNPLVTNGEFATLANWTFDNPSWASVDTTNPPPGHTQELRVATPGGGSGLGQITQNIAVPINTDYVARAWIKSSVAGKARLQVKVYNSGGTEQFRIDSPTSTTAWTQVTIPFNTGPSGVTATMVLRPDLGTASNDWWGGVELLPLTVAVRQISIGTVACYPTFESIGLYAGLSDLFANSTLQLSYRLAGQTTWNPALTPWFSTADKEVRGSVLQLAQNTTYNLRLQWWWNGVLMDERTVSPTTWAEVVPIDPAKDFTVSSSTSALTSFVSGDPVTGWARYKAAAGGTTIDVTGTAATEAVLLSNVHHVIIEGLTIKGGVNNAIKVDNSSDIRVRNCDISNWSEAGTFGKNTTANADVHYGYFTGTPPVFDTAHLISLRAGVKITGTASARVVVERNLIHHPVGTSASWGIDDNDQFANHPAGPSGIVVERPDDPPSTMAGGNHVIRFNDIIAGDGHYWNDAIEGNQNKYITGGPFRDSDYYGNLFAGMNDDGTELDGGQMNVRYWHNWIAGGNSGVSTAPNLKGPSYIFRNLVVTGDERDTSQDGFKVGGNPGMTYFYNNTVYTKNYGMDGGHYTNQGKDSPVTTRNNLFTGEVAGNGIVRASHASATSPWKFTGDVDYDLLPVGGLNSTLSGAGPYEIHAVYGFPSFTNVGQRNFLLSAGSAGADVGVVVPNITPAGISTPDMGAVDVDLPATTGTWPVRPTTTPSASPFRNLVSLRTGNSTNVSVTLTAPTTTGASWTAAGGESWLTVSPASGTTGSSPQTITCTVNAAALSVGTHHTFVRFRTDTGNLRSVLFDVQVAPATDVVLASVEAETLVTGGGDWEVKTDDAAASGGAYAHAISSATSTPLVMSFTPPSTGWYYVHARAKSDGPANLSQSQGSVYVSVNGAAQLQWDFTEAGTDWHSEHANLVPLAPAANFSGPVQLTGGVPCTIGVYYRQGGVRIDRLAVTNSPYTVP